MAGWRLEEPALERKQLAGDPLGAHSGHLAGTTLGRRASSPSTRTGCPRSQARVPSASALRALRWSLGREAKRQTLPHILSSSSSYARTLVPCQNRYLRIRAGGAGQCKAPSAGNTARIAQGGNAAVARPARSPKGAAPMACGRVAPPGQWEAPFPAGRALPHTMGNALMRRYLFDTALVRQRIAGRFDEGAAVLNAEASDQTAEVGNSGLKFQFGELAAHTGLHPARANAHDRNFARSKIAGQQPRDHVPARPCWFGRRRGRAPPG